MKGGLLGIADSSQGFGHNLEKYLVDAVQDRISAAEILVKLDFPVGAAAAVGFVFLQKQLRPCQTEAVDALLHIPHHKYIGMAMTFPGNGLNQHLLNAVAVLVLVYQNLLVLA